MKDKCQAHAALRPATVDAGMIRGNPAFIRSTRGSYIEMESGFFLGERSHFNAVNALIEAVEGGFQGAVVGLGNVQDEMQDGVPCLQRTGPVAFKSGGTPLRCRFRDGRSLCGSRRKKSRAEGNKSHCQTRFSELHERPPDTTFRIVDDCQRKRVGMGNKAEG